MKVSVILVRNFGQIFEISSNIKFQINPFSGSEFFFAGGRMD